AIYHLSDAGNKEVSTNAIAEVLKTKPASVSDMIGKLANKKAVVYKKYQGVNLSDEGKKEALRLIRKHRLWEVFLVDKLKFNWDEVHDVAEQLEHIDSPLLIKRLDSFLGHPKVDPHGHPIPDKDGRIQEVKQVQLSEAKEGTNGVLHSVNDGSPKFLQYLSKI